MDKVFEIIANGEIFMVAANDEISAAIEVGKYVYEESLEFPWEFHVIGEIKEDFDVIFYDEPGQPKASAFSLAKACKKPEVLTCTDWY